VDKNPTALEGIGVETVDHGSLNYQPGKETTVDVNNPSGDLAPATINSGAVWN